MENQDQILDNFRIENTNGIDEQKIISLNRFIFLSIISFGLYHIWWMYKAWLFYQQKEKLDIMPAARAFFSIFFLNSLFNRILEFAKEKGYNKDYSSTMLFIGYLVFSLLARLPEYYWIISILNFAFLIPSFKAFNFAIENSNDLIVTKQTSFSGRQIALIAIGVIFWGLIILGITIEM